MYMKNWMVVVGLLLALPGAVMAAKPGYLHVTETVEINAPAAKVWGLVKDWNGLHKWHPAFSNAEIKSGENNKVGAVRTLTLADGGAKFDEQLDGFSDKQRKYSYRIISDSPLPIADYSSSIQVKSGKAKGTSVLVWKGKFKRKVADNPPAGQDDAGVKKTISGAYQAGLQNAKKLAETK
ncbi:MAG TPA: SRPBCC family protein [Burkholderiales bacterium]|nr:SRPBCC family protein [Burkholderiales bacterium]